MKKNKIVVCAILLMSAMMNAGLAQTQTSTAKKNSNQTKQAAASAVETQAGGSSPVIGGGTADRLVKWTGSNSTSYTVGDSIITEDKFGKVGIGTPTPTSKLTVQGMIETTLGGYKFPDGTIQTTAALSGLTQVFHNATLKGDGTNAMPLGIAIPLALTGGTAGVPLVTMTQSAADERVLGIYGNSQLQLLEVRQTGVGAAIRADSIQGTGIFGTTNLSSAAGVIAHNFDGGEALVGLTIGTIEGAAGVTGRNDGLGYGVKGFSIADGGIGIYGVAGRGKTNNTAGLFENTNDANPMNALEAKTNGSGFALTVESTSDDAAANGGLFVSTTNGKAGKFEGDVEIIGNLNATGAKNFKIDHPLDPENKYLYHASIESSEVLNLYTGNITTDANGDAIVQMPEWFEALNKDARYQLTVIGTFAQAIVAEKIKGNRFVIKTNAANVEVSWQVTGIRNDPSAKRHPMQVEVEKSKRERGYYLQPELYSQPADKGIEFARQPATMKRIQDKKTATGVLQEQSAKLASDK
jgi:hypothetical protein